MQVARPKSTLLLLAILTCALSLSAQDLQSLLTSFQNDQDRGKRELVLENIVEHYPEAGPSFLTIAQSADDPKDPDLKWMAIRGLGRLKYKQAVPFLEACLQSDAPYVRANGAMALGQIGDTSATPALVRMLRKEEDSGVIEQTSLALLELKAYNALPVLKEKVDNPSVQTQTWVLGAIAGLASRPDIPYLATFLSNRDKIVEVTAAFGIERLTGQDFKYPCASNGPCDPSPFIANAQDWWEMHKSEFEQR